MKEDTVLFVTDHRVQIAIRVWTFRLKCKVGRFSRPVDRCSRLHKLTPEILQNVDHFLAIANPAPLDVKGHCGGNGSDRWNAEGRIPLAVGEIVVQIMRVIHGNIAHSERGHARAKVNFH